VHDVGHGLRVGGRPGPAAPDGVVHLGQFVRDAVCDVAACCRAAVGAQDDAVGEGDGHAEVGRGGQLGWVRGGRERRRGGGGGEGGGRRRTWRFRDCGRRRGEMVSLLLSWGGRGRVGEADLTSPDLRWFMSMWMPSVGACQRGFGKRGGVSFVWDAVPSLSMPVAGISISIVASVVSSGKVAGGVGRLRRVVGDGRCLTWVK